MKILHLCSTLGKHSGVMKVIIEYNKKLNEQLPFDYIYWVDDEINYKEEIEEMNGNVIKINKPSLTNVHSFLDIMNEVCSKYDIIHVHEMYLILFIYRIARKNNCKIIGHAHTTEYSDKFNGKIRNKILCHNVRKKVDGMLASSEEAGVFYFGQTFIDKGTVLPNAFEIAKYEFSNTIRQKYRKEFLFSDETAIFFHVGRFNKQKNHDKIIDVFNSYLKINQDTKLVLVGVGPEQKRIIELTKSLGIKDKILFLNLRDDVNYLLMMSDLFIFPSYFEGLGIALVEAQITGLKCFTSNKIPKEAFISSNVEVLNLNMDSAEWAKKINDNLTYSNLNREKLSIDTNFFNIDHSKVILYSFYKSIMKG